MCTSVIKEVSFVRSSVVNEKYNVLQSSFSLHHCGFSSFTRFISNFAILYVYFGPAKKNLSISFLVRFFFDRPTALLGCVRVDLQVNHTESTFSFLSDDAIYFYIRIGCEYQEKVKRRNRFLLADRTNERRLALASLLHLLVKNGNSTFFSLYTNEKLIFFIAGARRCPFLH